MTMAEVKAGKNWVAETLEKLSRSLNIPIDNHEWGQQTGSSAFGPYLLMISAKDKQAYLKLSYFDLCDCANDTTIQTKLSYQLKGFLRSLRKGTRGAFERGRKGE
jgi:hypothetical protein